ncbi:methyltransferase domain-containing protein [Rhodococcus tibetensis]|uniref:Class I SAM-dependent methyltransferase n=1 Tax=Rhodococcus tibetensis TaxID=2965064 RepID=A0ABT1QHD0_9NOCA|nr:methyltransferase domain-containing protein [Rhodococcus sp. FXJ9.536]MCQ4121200.1 class I SAM-dependent methyltransferase [Rhodococcus sp. FXJ9.536]
MSVGERSIGEYLISSRSMAEYRAMFALGDADLTGRVLDCPGGGASFTASAHQLGVDAMAVDPVYRRTAAKIAEHVREEVARGAQWATDHADDYRWEFYGNPDGHHRMRRESAEKFGADIVANPRRYRAGALPRLPFADGTFDLVLSSHLLFTYADRLDYNFHRAALRELARVAKGEVRVFPLVNQAGDPVDELLPPLLVELESWGLQPRVGKVDYQFQRGADAMLVFNGGTGP